MDPGRVSRLERILRTLRRRVFDEDTTRADLAATRIIKVKEVLAVHWYAQRAAREDRILQETPSHFEPGGGGVGRTP